MRTGYRYSRRITLLALALPLVLLFGVSRALASVAMSTAAADRAEAVSGVAPVLTQPTDMTLKAGETADQILHATDGDGDPLTFIKTSGPGYMTVTTTDPGTGAATGNVHLAPGSGDAGVTTALVTVSDGALMNSKSFRINAQGPSSAPIMTQPEDMTVQAGNSGTQTLYASDSNGDPLEFTLQSGPSYAFVTTTDPGSGIGAGEILVSPGSAVNDTASAIVEVSDGLLTDQKALLITVTPANTAPVLTQPPAMTVRVGETKDQALSAFDAEGDPLTFTKASGPAYMTVTTIDAANGSGNVRLTPGSGNVGSTTGQVRVSDGTATDQKSFSITVRTNTAPYLYSMYSMTLRANTTADQTLNAYDTDGDPLTFSKVGGPAFMTVTTTYPGAGNASGNLHLAPGSNDLGYFNGTVRVSDGALSADGFLNISVLAPNHPPVLVRPTDMTLTAGEIGEQTVTAADADGDCISISKYSGPAFVDVYGYGCGTASGTITARPGTSDVGNWRVTVSASDYTGADTSSFYVTVQAGNFPALCPSGSFAASSMFVGYGLIEVQTADLNGDGVPDLVAELPDQQQVAVLLGLGGGSFVASPLMLTAGSSPASGAIADFNADGIPDLAIANYGSTSVSIFLGDGSGGFGPKLDVSCGGNPRSIAVADLNRDGKPDLLVTRPSMNSVATLRGNGNGTFGAAVSIPAGYYAWGLAVADLNKDGAPDLIVTNGGDNDISVFLNNGVGGLGSRTDYAVENGPLGAAAGDLNGDGKLDVVVSSGDSNILSVFLGNGNGTLQARRNFSTHSRPSLVAIADLNGDGHPDVATANLYSGDASILLGDGLGALAPRLDVPTGGGAYGIAAGDFDDDLRTDLVVSNYDSGSLTLLMNGCAPLRDHPPVVHAPSRLTAGEGVAVAFTITATDPDGPEISSLTASFAGLPLGHNATFTANPGNDGGSFAWTPSYQDARSTAYPVTFTATDVLTGSATTKIVVTNTNRAPVASTGGPYSAFAGSALSFTATGSADPDGDGLTYAWIYGDGSTGTGVNPMHVYTAVGVYGVALTVSDGSLTGTATTTATIVGMLEARAFTANGNRTIRLGAGKPQWCVNIEPVGRSFVNVAVDLTTLVMKSAGTGSVSQIRAIQDKVSLSGDQDANGVEEIEACFAKSDLRLLFANLHGQNSVTVSFEGNLYAGGVFRAQMDINVQASGGGQLAASVSPNPLNPDAVLTFTTGKAGWARVDLFDLRGRMVRKLVEEAIISPGYHDVRIDGRDDHGERLASGVYFFRISAEEGVTTGQITVLK